MATNKRFYSFQLNLNDKRDKRIHEFLSKQENKSLAIRLMIDYYIDLYSD